MQRAHDTDDDDELDDPENPPAPEEEWMQNLLWPSPSLHDPHFLHHHHPPYSLSQQYPVDAQEFAPPPAVALPFSSSCASDSQPPAAQHLLLINGLPSPPAQQTSNFTKEKDQWSKKMMQQKVALETKSDIDILDDGFKWRKYGQKSVKNSKHPRSYYRCSMTGCPVKKRVERSTLDPSLVVTTYHSMHNHHPPINDNLESSWIPLSDKN